MPRCAIFSIAAHGKSRHGDLVGQAMIPVARMEHEHQKQHSRSGGKWEWEWEWW